MPRALRRAVPFLLACGSCGPLAAGEWSPPTRVVGLEVKVSAETLRVRTPFSFSFNPAACTRFDREWSIFSPDPSTPDTAMRRRMLEDIYLAFLLGHEVSLNVGSDRTKDCMAGNRVVTGVRVTR